MARFVIHESVRHSEIRLYLKSDQVFDADSAFQTRATYDALLSVTYETPEIVFVYGFISRVPISGRDVLQLHNFARANGIKKVRFERSGVIIEQKL